MCGIVGLAGIEDDRLIRRMAEAVAHRGPDGEGFFVGDGVSLGMRRLGIIDPAGSHQPIWNEDRSVLAIFNGEAYNYRQLRPFLEKHGHGFATAGDAETAVHLYEEYGEAGVHLLHGMFAYAIWDRRRRRLLLTRDRLGIKPLFYAQAGGRLAFASELKALLDVPGVDHALDADALAQYLTLQYVPGPATILSGVRKLPPGHWLSWQDGRVEVRSYWDLVLDDGEGAARRVDVPAAAAELRERLEDSIAQHQISDVPLGVLLSGGIDSAAVTALLARVSRRVQTFTVGFDVGGPVGELAEARALARHLGTDHHEIVMEPRLADTLPHIVRMQDEPLGDPAAVPTFVVCRFAARSVKVVLTGEGGDEVFGGYPRYGWLRLGERLRQWPGLATLAASLRRLPPGAREARVLRRVRALASTAALEDRHLSWVATMSDDLQRELTGTGWSAASGVLRRCLHRAGAGDLVHDLMYADVKTWLVDDVLVKTDRMSMAASIEARVPLLDHRLVEFAAGLPASVKVGQRGTKALLRRALRDDLPAPTRGRRKRAFLVPLRHWLGGELRELVQDTLTSSAARQRGLFRAEVIARLLREQEAGRHDHSRALWTLLCLELWFRNVLDAAAAAHD